MKFNLKNRPKINPKLIMSCHPKFYEEWFEGFEKELRKLQYTEPKTDFGKGWNAIIEEILGE